MKTGKPRRLQSSYLDVSQFMLKEHSPVIKPSPTEPLILSETHSFQSTPELAPIDHDPSQFIMTPIATYLVQHEVNETMDDIILGEALGFDPELKVESRRKKNKRNYPRESFSLQMFHISCDLERIIQKEEYQSSRLSQHQSDDCDLSEQSSEEEFGYANSNTIATYCALKIKAKNINFNDTEQQKQHTIDLSVVDYSQSINRFCQNPKLEITNKIRQIVQDESYCDEEEKKLMIKKYIEKYLLDYELYCYEESWKEINSTFQKTIQTILKGIQETFTKQIGMLPFENRRVKLLKYLQKKRRRIWRKKVSYDCRKKVADGRLRIKGKFVTREQACQQLGLQSLDSYSADEIKEMLQKKIDQSLNQLVVC